MSRASIPLFTVTEPVTNLVSVSSADPASPVVEQTESSGRSLAGRPRFLRASNSVAVRAYGAGDILMDWRQPRAGRVWVADKPGYCSEAFLILRSTGTNPRFVAYFLCSPAFREQLSDLMSGSAERRLSQSLLHSVQLPSPAPGDERGIALLDEANQLRALRQGGLSKRDFLLPSVFMQTCGSPSRLWSGKDVQPLESVAIITTGGTHAPQWGERLVQLALPTVIPSQLHDHDINPARHVNGEVARLQRYSAGAILVALEGPWRGRSGRLLSDATGAKGIVSVQSIDAAYPNAFLWAWLRMSREQIRARSPRELSINDIRGIPVPKLPAERVRLISQLVDELEAEYRSALRQRDLLNQLFESILYKTFQQTAALKPFGTSTPRNGAQKAREQRPVRELLSKSQLRVWDATAIYADPFSLDEIETVLRKKYRKAPHRQHLLGILDLLTSLGAIIKVGSADMDIWRRPNPETDGVTL